MSDYAGIVCTINTREFPGKDRIQLGDALGYQVVIGKDVQPGDLGVLFPPDGQLSEEFCAAHNLLRRDGGYFSDNRRVVAQRFAGVRSEAFWVPSHYLYYFAAGKPDVDNLKAGERITTFAGVPICNKWINPNTQRARQGTQRQGRPRPESPWFKRHYDTDHLRHASEYDFPLGSLVWVTEKLHGTSHREGLVPTPPSWLDRLLGVFGIDRTTWNNVSGSRRVVLGDLMADPYHGSDFRLRAVRDWRSRLRPGEVVYGEIVGYAGEKPIMPSHDPSSVSKDYAKYFPGGVHYDYGCEQGDCKFYAYRIVQHAPDGTAVELGYQNVIQRCAELGIEHCPVITVFRQGSKCTIDTEQMKEIAADMGLERARDGQAFEGICVRVERPDGRLGLWKEKTFEFKVMEGIATEHDIDPEEVA